MSKLAEIIEAIKGRLSVFQKVPPVRTSQDFGGFLATRASFISQKTLYGYVKTRMGMKYPKMFEEDLFIESLNIAKWQVYTACLSDLAVFMAAEVFEKTGDKQEIAAIASHWFSSVIHDRFDNPEFTGDSNQLIADFDNRLALTDWKNASQGENAFKLSPDALIRWAPIDDNLKKYDKEIVRNSIRFQWQRIRSDFRSAFEVEAFLSDWRSRTMV